MLQQLVHTAGEQMQYASTFVGQEGPIIPTALEYGKLLYRNTFAGMGMQEIAATAREEIQEAEVAGVNALGKVALGGNLGYFVFEQAGGNESLIGKAGGTALKLLDMNPIIESVAAGAASSTVSFLAVQLPLAGLTAYSMGKFPRTIQTTQEWLGRSVDFSAKPSRLKQFFTAMTFGSGATVFFESIKNPDLDFRGRFNKGLRSAKMIAAGVFGIGGLVGATAKVVEHAGYPAAAETMVDVVTNPLPWLGTFSALNYADWKKHQNQAKALPEPEPTRLPEAVREQITPAKAWLGVSALAAMSARGHNTRSSAAKDARIVNAAIHSGVKWLNKRKTLPIPAA